MSKRLSNAVAGVALCLLCSVPATAQSLAENSSLPIFKWDAWEVIKTRDVPLCWNCGPEPAKIYREYEPPRFSRSPFSFFSSTEEIRQIDLEGLKKLLQPDQQDPRPLLINFWATWCDPCREEFPDLVKIDEDYGPKKLNFVAISLDDVTEIATEVPKFLKEMKAAMPVVLLNVNDPEPAIKTVDAAWDGQLPATFLYDKQGNVIFKHFGRIKPDELRAAIDKAVEIKKPQ
jgi:thiol-disulfide isomerase/thioredoxin